MLRVTQSEVLPFGPNKKEIWENPISNCAALKIKKFSHLASVVCAVHQTLLDIALPKRVCDRSGRGDITLDITH